GAAPTPAGSWSKWPGPAQPPSTSDQLTLRLPVPAKAGVAPRTRVFVTEVSYTCLTPLFSSVQRSTSVPPKKDVFAPLNRPMLPSSSVLPAKRQLRTVTKGDSAKPGSGTSSPPAFGAELPTKLAPCTSTVSLPGS